jgi:hypothetical protein
MEHSDFYVGLEFSTSAGFRWRCTDIGSRTIIAIRLDHDSKLVSRPALYRGGGGIR